MMFKQPNLAQYAGMTLIEDAFRSNLPVLNPKCFELRRVPVTPAGISYDTIRLTNPKCEFHFTYEYRDNYIDAELLTVQEARERDNRTDTSWLLNFDSGRRILWKILQKRGLGRPFNVNVQNSEVLAAWTQGLFIDLRDHCEDILDGSSLG